MSELKPFSTSRSIVWTCSVSSAFDYNLLLSQQYICCSLVLLCVFMAVSVWSWVWRGRRSVERGLRRRESDWAWMWVSLAQCTSLAVCIPCDVWWRARHDVNIKISLELRKGGQAELRNLSCCLVRDCRPWSERPDTQFHTHCILLHSGNHSVPTSSPHAYYEICRMCHVSFCTRFANTTSISLKLRSFFVPNHQM